MSHVSVNPDTVREMAGHLRGRSTEVGELHARAGVHRAAAADTGAHEAVGELMSRWADALPHFARAADGLMAAMHGAAAAYQGVESATERAARESTPR